MGRLFSNPFKLSSYYGFIMKNVSFHFSGKTIFLLILIAASTVLIHLLNQNQIGMAQQQNNQTSSSLTNQQKSNGISFQIDNTTFSLYNSLKLLYSFFEGNTTNTSTPMRY
jgi:hypothetical protein